jgi:hypothetical protein
MTVEERGKRGDAAANRRDLFASLLIMSILVAFALTGLMWDENWRKVLRVGVGFSAYIVVLMTAIRVYSLEARGRASLPFWAFALAGAAAEACSGWLRPQARWSVDIPTVIMAAILIGGAHWLGLRFWRPLRERIFSFERKAA